MLDIFIEGEVIDLRIPTLELAETSDWYKWFNHPHTTAFLEHGVFPNTREKQIEFFKRAMDERLLLMVTNKDGTIIGSTSLMNIDYKTRTAGSGLVIGDFICKNPLEALEAVARITEHGFCKLGLKRIEAAQHIKLIPWSHRMSLIGYRLEGIFQKAFVKGIEVVDVLRISAHYDDYEKIIASRGGGYGILKKKCLSVLKNFQSHLSTKNFKSFLKNPKSIIIIFLHHKEKQCF
ncbi:hypothetical protein BBW65_04035 [Helicobacter enhydrae]|uniref:N-acetyltransferase domain-containing protein n=1 Tax=Helicobacter enhydrae TaxID=222136 RepID=A0A1B1U5J2_9HELI|nr:GNAT family protein [Helicobacter enhydrae]ANV98020.1 hypothetical protein BBW65_04035 [Helicobacter enhydrae]